MTIPFLSLIIFTVFATSVLSGILGMAGGMILMGIFAALLPVQQAMILHAISQFFSNASRAFFHRQHIYRAGIGYYLLGLCLVVGIFSAVSFVTNEKTIFLLLGISPFAAYALPKSLKLDFTKPFHAFLCGASTTGFQLSAGVGGPLLDVFFQNRTLSRHQTIATKAFTQSIAHLVKFIYFAVIVGKGHDMLAGLPPLLCLAVIPVAMVGAQCGKLLLDKMTDHQFYRATQALLLVIGAAYLIKAFAG